MALAFTLCVPKAAINAIDQAKAFFIIIFHSFLFFTRLQCTTKTFSLLLCALFVMVFNSKPIPTTPAFSANPRHSPSKKKEARTKIEYKKKGCSSCHFGCFWSKMVVVRTLWNSAAIKLCQKEMNNRRARPYSWMQKRGV